MRSFFSFIFSLYHFFLKLDVLNLQKLKKIKIKRDINQQNLIKYLSSLTASCLLSIWHYGWLIKWNWTFQILFHLVYCNTCWIDYQSIYLYFYLSTCLPMNTSMYFLSLIFISILVNVISWWVSKRCLLFKIRIYKQDMWCITDTCNNIWDHWIKKIIVCHPKSKLLVTIMMIKIETHFYF